MNSVALWALGATGITEVLGVRMAPTFTPQWLYPRLVWGGMWGMLFLIPVLRRSIVKRGFLFSLGPTVVQLFVVFPEKAGLGVMGLELGTLTPAFVVLLNAIWGICAAFWLRLVK
jgi:hypothetical protein